MHRTHDPTYLQDVITTGVACAGAPTGDKLGCYHKKSSNKIYGDTALIFGAGADLSA